MCRRKATEWAEKRWFPAAQPLRSALTYVEADLQVRLLLEVSRDKVRPSVNGSVAQPSRHARDAGSCRRAAPGCCAAIAVECDRRGAVPTPLPISTAPLLRSVLPLLPVSRIPRFRSRSAYGLSGLRGRLSDMGTGTRIRVWISVCRYPYYGPGFYDPSSSVRLQVTPREAEVYIDGYYAGMVDHFDGTFQRLHLEPGEHDLQLFMPGIEASRRRFICSRERVQRAPRDGAAAALVKPNPRGPWPHRVRRRSGPNHTVGQIVQTPWTSTHITACG